MDEARFWNVVAMACRSDPRRVHEWHQRLQAELEKFEPAEIIECQLAAIRRSSVRLWRRGKAAPHVDSHRPR
ncbi:MAG TPA: hypothetical protein VGY66_22065 [Gemmataceae bacterium]|jgi:hypothetical protein|nr:hypothetical protein [Gemmataceae bacterium]